MKTSIKAFLLVFVAAITFHSCSDNSMEKQAQHYLQEAKKHADKGEFDQALANIDSLRKNCRQDIKAREAALKLYQSTELKRAQQTVQQVDAKLQQINSEYNKMSSTVSSLKKQGIATAQQLEAFTKMRILRDSLQTAFDTECAKVRFIKQKMSEQ